MTTERSDYSADKSLKSTARPRDDLIIGLVGAVGTDLPWVESQLAEHLESLGFDARRIALSALMRTEYGDVLPSQDTVPYEQYVGTHMTAGNVLRAHWRNAEALALLAVEEIRRQRDRRESDSGPPTAFILRSLKRPEEARLLNEVYRGQFLLIGCHTPRETRIRQLADTIAKSRGEASLEPHRAAAEKLANRDEHELGPPTTDPAARKWHKDYGQNVEDSFPVADAYVNLEERSTAAGALRRFCDLVLGSPFVSPSKEEFAMFHAGAAAVRSADLSRQVGAAIATAAGDIIAVGCNDVPRAGGGLYWEGEADDARDFRRGLDANQDQRTRALHEVFNVLKARGLLTPQAASDGHQTFARTLDDTRVDGLIEFTRSTHAEMAALLDAARRGVSVQDAILYASTFPCHNCAKHIITAGISRVVFIEPYPKSLAEQLHGDAITVDDLSREDNVVHFQHFTGVSPRNYIALFATPGKRKTDDGIPIKFSREAIRPKLRANFNRNLEKTEEETIERLKDLRNEHGSPTKQDLLGAPQIGEVDDTHVPPRPEAVAVGQDSSEDDGLNPATVASDSAAPEMAGGEDDESIAEESESRNE